MGLINRTEREYQAEVETREPEYTTTDTEHIAVRTIPAKPPYPPEFETLAELPRMGRRVPFAAETRNLITVDFGQQVQTATLDGTGLGTFDFGNVPTNEYWVVDTIVARAGAAGSMHLYERGSASAVNPQDLVWADLLAGPGFSKASAPNEIVLRPGAHPIGEIVGGGAAAVATMRILYRVALLVIGEQKVRP